MERWLGSQLILFRALVMIEESREELRARVGAVLAWLGLGCQCHQEVPGEVGAWCQVVHRWVRPVGPVGCCALWFEWGY